MWHAHLDMHQNAPHIPGMSAGGGQPVDAGFVRLRDTTHAVLDVQEAGPALRHYVGGNAAQQLSVGTEVELVSCAPPRGSMHDACSVLVLETVLALWQNSACIPRFDTLLWMLMSLLDVRVVLCCAPDDLADAWCCHAARRPWSGLA